MPSTKTDAAAENIGELRARIEKLQVERRATEIAPRSRSEALALIDRHVEVKGQAAGRMTLERFADPKFKPGSLTISDFDSVEAGLCRVIPGPMKEFFREELTAYLEGRPQGISDAIRAKTVERLDRQILELEVQEELVVCEMEATSGAEVDRRADLAPGVFLEIVIEDEAA